jgi:hypothetical protein
MRKMSTETITLEIDSESARLFKSASAEEREKLKVLLGVWLKEYARADVVSLREMMDELSSSAQDKGLTPEILESVLEEE